MVEVGQVVPIPPWFFPGLMVGLSVIGVIVTVVLFMMTRAKTDRDRVEATADEIKTDVGEIKTGLATHSEWIRNHDETTGQWNDRIRGLEDRERDRAPVLNVPLGPRRSRY